MNIPSYPPTKPRPTPQESARHINEEARIVLTSLRGGPPYVARGELALGLRDLRSFVRGRFLDSTTNSNSSVGGGVGSGENVVGVGDYQDHTTSSSHSASASAVVVKTPREDEDKDAKDVAGSEPATAADVSLPTIRVPPPSSPTRGDGNSISISSSQVQCRGDLPPPPLPAVPDEENTKNDTNAKEADADANNQISCEGPGKTEEEDHLLSTPPSSPIHLSPPTPHSVPPSSPDPSTATATTTGGSLSLAPPPPIFNSSNPSMPFTPDLSHHHPQVQLQLPSQPNNQQQQQTILDPGPYATPFLAVIVDPRAAGPHTLIALRALHRLLERGSIVQVTRSAFVPGGGSTTTSRSGETKSNTNNGINNNNNTTESSSLFAFETTLEPIARGVLACRFEQTDAGADEAVEMAIADLLKLLVELDAAGARAAEAALVRTVYLKRQQQAQQQQQLKSQKSSSSTVSANSTQSAVSNSNTSNSSNLSNSNKATTTTSGTKLRIQRLPSSILMEAFHAVFITRHTFVRDGGGHHSPALSFHFEQVLTHMVFCVFGGEDAQQKSSLKHRSGMMSSRHVGAARKILEFLIDSLSLRRGAAGGGGGGADGDNDSDAGWDAAMMDGGEDGRTLCLRLLQCCLRTGWGPGCAMMASTGGSQHDDQVLLRLIEDDLCLALLTIGQAIWSHHDITPSGSAAASSTSTGADMLGGGPTSTSIGLLSEVCATLSLLWSLPRLRLRLRSQFESIFCGFYQRALSLLRRRPLPTDGVAYQANMIFDMEVEVILESLVDILCLSSSESTSTMESLFRSYDCSMTKSDVASGLLGELSRCCGGMVDEDGEPYLPMSSASMPTSRSGTSGAPTPSNDSEKSAQPMLIARHRSVPDHLKELCFEALLGSLKRLFHGAESLSPVGEASKNPAAEDGAEQQQSSSSHLRTAKNKKRCLHHAARLFNEKSKKGLQYLAENGMLPTNPPDAKSVASFLRNGLVVGLDKAAVGQYLGELGKSDKNAVVWDQTSFHKELLTEFCSSFSFEHLTVLDGLRMFLATFRLPGEAQMIDRILQAFSESIARHCQESSTGSLKLFSTDEKKASDGAYLLSFSIIMLTTDLHNKNIREDRKMKLKDFIKNNKNYGKEISDNDLPDEYLEGIYRSIKHSQIRTMGEGADGSMTAERWMGVMRSASRLQSNGDQQKNPRTAAADAKDLKELLLESSWQPILSAVSGLWGMVPWEVYQADSTVGAPEQSGTLMGSRLGIDLAHEMLSGASNLSRPDIFQDLFTNVCHMSGLLSQYEKPIQERADNFISGIEQQSAFTVAVNVAEEHGDMIGLDGWKCVWGMLFELRDLQLLSGRRRPNIMKESDPDLLSPEARAEFNYRMANWDEDFDQVEGSPRKSGLLSFVFGSSGSLEGNITPAQQRSQSSHGKENQMIWDDFAPSDEEDDQSISSDTAYMSFPSERSMQKVLSIGASFENQLVQESTLDNEEFGVTGLERIDMSHSNPNSVRRRVRRRLSQLIDFYGLIAESRYLSEEGLSDTLNSLVETIRDSSKKAIVTQSGNIEGALVGLPISPASEAFAEVLLCEISLKNRDRFALVWDNILRAHYNSRLTPKHHRDKELQAETLNLTPGIEKCVAGILRLCVWSSNRNILADQVLSTLKILHPPFGALIWSPMELNLDKHLAEGLWRISRNVDGLAQIDNEGWGGILGLAEWCAIRGGIQSNDQLGNLAEDDPSLQAFRSLHLILHAVELKDTLQVHRWPQIVRAVRCLVEAGERGDCPKLSIAGLDLLQVLHTRMESLVITEGNSENLVQGWVPILEAISEPAEKSRNGSVRQQAISLLTDTLLDRHGSKIPLDSGLCEVMNTICIPLAEKRITDLLRIPYDVQSDLEETLIELELCISLLFKPFLHHLKALISSTQEFVGIWISMLGIMTQLLGDESAQSEEDTAAVREGVVTREKLFLTTRELGSEHLRNAIMVLAALINDGASKSDAKEISSVTWSAISSIGYCKPYLEEWKSMFNCEPRGGLPNPPKSEES